jgi:hypothetical protein
MIKGPKPSCRVTWQVPILACRTVLSVGGDRSRTRVVRYTQPSRGFARFGLESRRHRSAARPAGRIGPPCCILLPAWAASSMVEQQTLNLRVQGSSPWPLTKPRKPTAPSGIPEGAFVYEARDCRADAPSRAPGGHGARPGPARPASGLSVLLGPGRARVGGGFRSVRRASPGDRNPIAAAVLGRIERLIGAAEQ